MEETMGFVRRAKYTFALAGAAWLAVGGMPSLYVGMAQAQDLAWGRRSCPPVQCPTPQEKPALEMPPAPPLSPETPPSEPLLTPERAAAFEGETVALAVPNMLGDFLAPSCALRMVQVPGQFIVIPGTPGMPGSVPFPGILNQFVQPPQPPQFLAGQGPVPGTPAVPGTPPTFIPVFASFIVPSASHEFKIADNESPRPQDRFFSSFNYYNDVERDANSRIGADIGRINVYRQIIGFEKTFLGGNASIGMRLPFNLLDAPSDTPSLGGTFADIGDLTIILKALLWENLDRGFLFSAGVAVTVPTGPDAFAGVSSVVGAFHNTLVQPYIGSIWTLNNLFVQGFSEIDIPTDSNDVTFWYDDFGIGYFLLRGRSGFITALAPTFEAHFNFPLSHRSGMCGVNIPDWVDLTEGFTVEFNRRATLAIGVSTPVTGPKPYDLEALAHFNIRF
jgi:hypothetical protein